MSYMQLYNNTEAWIQSTLKRHETKPAPPLPEIPWLQHHTSLLHRAQRPVERHTQTHTDTQTDRDARTYRHTGTETDTDTDIEMDTRKDTDKHTHRDADTQKHADTDTLPPQIDSSSHHEL